MKRIWNFIFRDNEFYALGCSWGYRYLDPAEGKYAKAAEKAVAHGISRVAIAKARNRSAKAAFWSGFAASGFSMGNKGYGGVPGRTLITAAVSGTVSEATGGKFANGAVSGAFIHLFNAENGIKKKLIKIVGICKNGNIDCNELLTQGRDFCIKNAGLAMYVCKQEVTELYGKCMFDGIPCGGDKNESCNK